MTILLIILSLFYVSELTANYKPFLKKKTDYDQAYYYFKGNKYIRNYAGICFKGINEVFVLFTIQRGYDNDRCLTICNISFIFPRKK